jgi:hypothetical protein
MMDLTLRHLRRHWRLNLAVLLCLTLASALLAGFSGYTVAVATQELHQTLDEARPAERSLLITGSRYTFSEALYELLQDKLGQVLEDRVVIRHATLSADQQPSVEGTQAVALLDVYSFDRLPERVRVVEGRLPAQVRLREAEDAWRPPPIEAVIGMRAAERSGTSVGDRLTGSGTYHRLDIVGIVDPLDPHDDIWGEDTSAFAVVTATHDLNADATALPLIIAPASMQSNYPEQPIFPHQVSWRITLNHRLISVDRAKTLHSDLINFQTQSATMGATASTDVVRILADYLARLSRVRMTFFLLTAQTLVFVLYTLTTFTSFTVDRSQVELATLSARGANAWQITRVFALENLILALPALLLGPGLAQGALRLWSGSTGKVVPGTLPGEAWLLSGLAVGLGWLALVLPVFLAARRNAPEWQSRRAPPSQLSAAQKHYLDLYLLAFGGLLYWQLNQSGSFVMRRLENTQLADPLLLIGPSLLLIAIAMVSLRILPFLLRLVAWILQRLRGLVVPLGLSRLARDPLQPSRVVLLISLTAGLMLFTRTFGGSLDYSQEAFQSDALARGTGDAFRLNALTLLLFSVTVFFLDHFISAQGRVHEFGVLRAMGLSVRQWLTLLVIEGILVLLLGLLAGTFVGLGLSHVMIPYLSQTLGDSLAGIAIERIPVDWPAVARLHFQMIAVYGSALALLVLVLLRTPVRWAVWMEDE